MVAGRWCYCNKELVAYSRFQGQLEKKLADEQAMPSRHNHEGRGRTVLQLRGVPF